MSYEQASDLVECVSGARRRPPAMDTAEFVAAEDRECDRGRRLKALRTTAALLAQDRVLDPISVPDAAHGTARAEPIVVEISVDVYRASTTVATIAVRR